MLRDARTLVSIARARDAAEPESSESALGADVALRHLIEGLVDDSHDLEARLRALEAVAGLLHSEVEASTRRLRQLVTQIELAEERLQHGSGATAAAACRGASERLRLLQSPGPAGREQRDSLSQREHLAAREREVLTLLTEGMRSSYIAQKLGIKTATVEVHRRNIMRKLNLHSIAALTKYALRAGLISL
jgi:DNA-binding NarL/FixJ family response regulator